MIIKADRAVDDADGANDGQPTHVSAGSPIKNVPLDNLARYFPARFEPCFLGIHKKISARLAAELKKPIQIHASTTVCVLLNIQI